MNRLRTICVWALVALTAAPSGCQWHPRQEFVGCSDECYDDISTQIEYPAESPCTEAAADESLASAPPWTLSGAEHADYWDISLAEVIQIALANSEVLRDLGGAVVEAPTATRTTLDAAITETDPRFGVEAALSDFDAQFISSVFWESNDRALNNEFFGGGTRILLQDAGVFQAAITKRAASGSQFTIRHNVDYDANNAPGNLFPSAWNANVEAEIRQPLLQGAGTEFNRIAGPFGQPGVYNGVLVARLNTDVALTDFEIAVRDLTSNLENAYWDLYYGYRDLDAKIKARDAALDTWRKIYALYETGRRGGEAEKEAQAREQYFRFQEEVQNALSGQLIDGTRTGNGSVGGTFRASGGVLVAERKLRVLMGMPPSDGRLMRPIDEPIMAKVSFDWEQATHESALRRAELRRQKWNIRRRELELIASKNFLMPRFDAVGRYRWRGFGDDLIDPNGGDLPRFSNAYGDLTSGDFQEWQLGLELSIPIGYRRGHAAVRNAELILARERALLRDQQLEVVHELADAIGEMDRAFTVSQTGYNRLIASRQQLAAVQAAYEADKAPLDLFLDAQRRLAESESRYYRVLAEYAVATKNVHFVKGTLLEYDGVYLSEGPWPCQAYEDAAEIEGLRGDPRPLNYASSQAPVVSWGEYPQASGGGDVHQPADEWAVEQPPMDWEVPIEPAEPTSALAPTKIEDKTPQVVSASHTTTDAPAAEKSTKENPTGAHSASSGKVNSPTRLPLPISGTKYR